MVFRNVVRPIAKRYPINEVTIPLLRTAIDTAVKLRPDPQGVEREQILMNGFRMEVVRTVGDRRPLSEGAVMYMHGGAFFIGGIETHRPIAAALARRTGLPVVNVEYRQLGGTRIPESITDCMTAYRWLLRKGADPSRVVFAGDSAGGFLSFATALRAAEESLPAPAGIVGISPLLDLDYRAKRGYENVERDDYIPLAGLQRMVRLGAEVDKRLDPALSPVNCALHGLPPVLLIVGEDELLRYDCELMAHRLAEAGVPATLELWRGQVHAFMSIAPGLPESRMALARVARFIRARTEANPVARTA
ncbi:alpha/beta hydrolase [Nocardia stercoris]|nr:alpha/beta hydrolase [Nocardia stercoris]